MFGHPIPAQPAFQDLTGRTYGRLTVVAYAGRRRWHCRCACGSLRVVRGPDLKNGNSKSCGCLSREVSAATARAHNRRHGMRDTPEYAAWKALRGRCLHPGHQAYHNYGARGVRVCERWAGAEGFVNFFADMGPRPSSHHTLERIDNEGHYEPGNCCWATTKAQSRNKRTSFFIEHQGRRLTLAGWAEVTGLSRYCIRRRLKAGWDVARALSAPPRQTRRVDAGTTGTGSR
jgi:hypothetical protein